MPVIVVGADTPEGALIIDRLHSPDREVRVFVSDVERGLELKERGFKVAIGDVSDESHVEAAATRCFSAVLVGEAAYDDRLRSFAKEADQVLRGWANAVTNSKVRRVIWVADGDPPKVDVLEVAQVDPDDPDLADKVYSLDEVESLS
ncbi:MAG TPA: hypothetical protein VFP42_07865 [Acidimicrobiia bacterium]|nr:hypothetical protein [Acidimicrobiia bacterium]